MNPMWAWIVHLYVALGLMLVKIIESNEETELCNFNVVRFVYLSRQPCNILWMNTNSYFAHFNCSTQLAPLFTFEFLIVV